MAAYVAVRAQPELLVAHHEYGLRARMRGQVAPRPWERGDVARQLPGALEDQPLLGLEDFRVGVERRQGREQA